MSILKRELPSNIARLSSMAVRELQVLLNKNGFNLAVDGIVGPNTTNAFNAFKTRHKLTHPNEIGDFTYKFLVKHSREQVINTEQLKRIYTATSINRINQFIGAINQCLSRFQITTPPRITAFLAQIGHESGGLRWVEELASGHAYEGRRDLGNTRRGDGARFKGRGLIQVTGRYNYGQVARYFNIDCINNPRMLAQLPYSVLTAGWYWDSRGLNRIADRNTLHSFKLITRRINGGYNGLQDRLSYWNRAKAIIR